MTKLSFIVEKLKPISETPRLDAELLLMHVLKKTRAQVLLLETVSFSADQEKQFNALLSRRLSGEPMAYILGEKAFWSLTLTVSPQVLIPRPDTECLVEYILKKYKDRSHLKVADIGTGSGAIALALAYEKPRWIFHATDNSSAAISIAKENAKKYHLDNVAFYEGHFCEALPDQDYDVIVSNPPYIEEKDPHLDKLTFEPNAALVSGEDGLDAIREIAKTARCFLNETGLIAMEHGYNQSSLVREILKQNAYQKIKTHLDLAGQDRFTCAKKQ